MSNLSHIWYIKLDGERFLEEYVNGEWRPVEERNQRDDRKYEHGRYGNAKEGDRRR
jgi:hypothetical protein